MKKPTNDELRKEIKERLDPEIWLMDVDIASYKLTDCLQELLDLRNKKTKGEIISELTKENEEYFILTKSINNATTMEEVRIYISEFLDNQALQGKEKEEVCFDNVYKCSVCGNTETFWTEHNYVHCKKCDNEMHR